MAGCGGEPNTDQRLIATDPIVVTKSAARPAPPRQPVGSCSTIGLTNVVGQPYNRSIALQAQDASRSSALRVIEPGDGPAAPADGNRLTLSVNQNGTIIDAACG